MKFIDCSKINEATPLSEVLALKNVFPEATTIFLVVRYSRAKGWVIYPCQWETRQGATNFIEMDTNASYQFYTIVEIKLPGKE